MKQNGIAILVVLFILLLMSIAAITINRYWLHIFFITSTRQFQQQDKWLLLGAEAAFKKSLTQIKHSEFNNNSEIHKWLDDQKHIYLDDVVINVRAFNSSGCFNINSLYETETHHSSYPKEIFKNLLINSGVKQENIDGIMSIFSDKTYLGNDNYLNKHFNKNNDLFF